MKPINNHITFFLIFLASCIGTKSTDKNQYIGNFKEQNYPFFESIYHAAASSNSYKIPFDIKFGGIRPNPYSTGGNQEFKWLRNQDNLLITFNTVKSIGLEKFATIEQYNTRTNDWCCNTQWENKSLNEVVNGFIQSDTVLSNDDYYSKFWQRRRKEGNLKITYQILNEIHKFYNGGQIKTTSLPVDTIMKGLLRYDLQLSHSDSNSYKNTAINYFHFLKSVKLEYSAYKLIFHNSKLQLPQKLSDSLLSSLNYDIISYDSWQKMNDNNNGWIRSGAYPDPSRNYGP